MLKYLALYLNQGMCRGKKQPKDSALVKDNPVGLSSLNEKFHQKSLWNLIADFWHDSGLRQETFNISSRDSVNDMRGSMLTSSSIPMVTCKNCAIFCKFKNEYYWDKLLNFQLY